MTNSQFDQSHNSTGCLIWVLLIVIAIIIGASEGWIYGAVFLASCLWMALMLYRNTRRRQ